MIIAIDGPSGAGKSTLGKRLAKELGLLYLDTGAMYRAAALAVLEKNKSVADQTEVNRIVAAARINLSGTPEDLHVYLDGREVSNRIRTPEISQAASIISANPVVRQILVERQRELGLRGSGCVLDGRDIGTTVFPNADVKIFLTAAPESRARRRFAELQKQNPETDYAETLREIVERDERDTRRLDSPLKKAHDAFVINSTDFSLEDTFLQILNVVRQRRQNRTDA